MLILLNKKVNMLLKVDSNEIPIELYSSGQFKKFYNAFFFTIDDFKSNINTVPEIINLNHVKQLAVCDESEIMSLFHSIYLVGANTKVIFNDNSAIYVAETLQEIQARAGIV